MKNVTVTVPDEVYRSARIRAAEEGTSVSGLVTGFLCSLTDASAEFERLARLQQEVLAQITAFSAADRLPRDEVHDRALR